MAMERGVNVNMRYFSYVVARDYGFAPNPYGNVCTLATCKPDIRKAAKVGDWIFGTGSVQNVGRDKLIYAMKVDEIISFNDYFSDQRFKHKKPNMLGSKIQMYGDNIYELKDGIWHQSDSHHSLTGGLINEVNLKKDTKSTNVLISLNYYYFGQDAIAIPHEIKGDVLKKGQGYRYIRDPEIADELIKHIELQSRKKGMIGFPCKFKSDFTRFKGD